MGSAVGEGLLLMGSAVGEGLPGTSVETSLDATQLAGAYSREVAALRQVLARRPFVFSLLPRWHGECGSQK